MNAVYDPPILTAPVTSGVTPETPHAPTEVRAEPLTTLRNTRVAVDPRRVGVVVVALFAVSLAVSSVALFAAGAHRNAQITALREHGIRVQETVSDCTGLLGGSGSNAAGYSCRGSLSVDGRIYEAPVPGSNTLYPPGTKLLVVADPSDPGLVSSVSAVATENATWTVFILPCVLTLVFLSLLGAVGIRLRRRD